MKKILLALMVIFIALTGLSFVSATDVNNDNAPLGAGLGGSGSGPYYAPLESAIGGSGSGPYYTTLDADPSEIVLEILN